MVTKLDSRPHIVGLGASAGGIEAFRDFFAAMPARNGLIFVVVLHLAPERSSMLAQILGQWTAMPVRHAEDGLPPVPETVYVIPPDSVLTISEGVLRLGPPPKMRHASAAIDALFTGMAAEYGERAIGIVLSGTGSDGALGLRAIKERGGVTLAQGHDGTAPGYDGMPNAAIATGAVDLVVPVQDMPARILALVGGPAGMPNAPAPAGGVADPGMRLAICAVLQETVGHDFSQYKEQTFLRRVQRRMQVTGRAADTYLALLKEDRSEAVLLFRDLLIGVTGFFRDHETFEMVQDTVLPRLFKGRSGKDQLRVWVPGCATGEEAYSLAIMLVEYAAKLQDPPQVHIFATDIDGPAIDIARLGRYPLLLLRDMAPERLARYFTNVDDSYVVSRQIRDLCTFSSHSVIREPPFSRMNLISCRNLLIYLDMDLQAQVIPAFHYSLAPDGLLLLGAYESVARHGDLFTAIDRKHRIYVRNDVPSPPLQVSSMGTARRMKAPQSSEGCHHMAGRDAVVQAAQRRIRDRFSPAFAVVTAAGEVVHFSARVSRYLEIPAGPPSSNLMAQAKTGLRLELRSALRRAVEGGRPVEREHVVVQSEQGLQPILLTVEPLPGPSGAAAASEQLYLVVFADEERHARTDFPPGALPGGAGGGASRPLLQDLTIEQLERELRDMREQNQSVAEAYETALEELKSANEELHSVNEELQSSNEELETSKEEIQAVNEELQTVNHQLTGKVDELDRASSDLRNLFESTRVPTMFLDRQMVIRSFTPAMTGIYNLIPADTGRRLTDIVSQLAYDALPADVARVLDRLEPLERRVERHDGLAHYQMRLLPYRSSADVVEGVLITFIDVTSMVLAERHDKLLVDELNHRVKNMLTVVISLATQTRRNAGSIDDFWDAFIGRVRALSAAYTLLSRDQWTDIPLQDVLREELTPFLAEGRANIAFDGPPMFLRPKGALAFGMVVHELATNAVRYGGLSVAEGSVEIGWEIAETDGRDIMIWHWSETGGPPVAAPARRGFGMSLVERSTAHEMGGRADIAFRPTGLQARLLIPLDELVVARTTTRGMPSP